jgi:hypothetical protein
MKMQQHINEIKSHNFLSDFILVELVNIKNNISKCEPLLMTALSTLCMPTATCDKTTSLLCTSDVAEELTYS